MKKAHQLLRQVLVSFVILGAFVFYSLLRNHFPLSAFAPDPSNGSHTSSQAPTTTSLPEPPGTTPKAGTSYKDGEYTGDVADAQWGVVQVKAIIKDGKITDVQFLQYPNDRSRSVRINSTADPELTSEAVQAQSANVDIVTGATDSSEAFIQSLSDALSQARS